MRMDKWLPVINNTTNLSERLPVINDTTNLNKGLPIINNTTNLSEKLPVINNTTDLSEGFLVINDISANITCVVCPLNQCFNDLCSQQSLWLSFQSTLDDLCGCCSI